ncbi:MAG: hypothetical protein EPN93_12685 [Spirochaetes bacterium]|nr:MAG: hypothetical protein EPN93_12685 [Spirochaetota bacterium]
MKFKGSFVLPALIFLAAHGYAFTADDLMGKWAVAGSAYAYIYEFQFSGAAEKRMILGGDMVVWTGTGSFAVKGNTLTVTLDSTASNTPLSEVFIIESFNGTKLVLRGKGRYFKDIDADRVEFVRIPD